MNAIDYGEILNKALSRLVESGKITPEIRVEITAEILRGIDEFLEKSKE